MFFTGQLYPYQSTVSQWAQLSCHGAILALDMGLGKTIITLSIICDQKYDRVLIISPLCVIHHWYQHILEFTNLTTSDVILYHGPKRNQFCLTRYQVIITTYDLVRRDQRSHQSTPLNQLEHIDCTIFDEAHIIRNTKTKGFAACKMLSLKSRHNLLLTGTTIHNRIQDLGALIDILNIPQYGTKWFKSANFKKQLQRWKHHYYYTLQKNDVLDSLPVKQIEQHQLSYQTKEHRTYNRLEKKLIVDYLKKKDISSRECVLPLLLKLRQACNHLALVLSIRQMIVVQNRLDK